MFIILRYIEIHFYYLTTFTNKEFLNNKQFEFIILRNIETHVCYLTMFTQLKTLFIIKLYAYIYFLNHQQRIDFQIFQ